MWRLDRAWAQLGAEVPHLDRLPSEVIREHFWVTTQPIEEPPRREDWHAMLAGLGMDDRIMFATDYPHWDFDSPEGAIPSFLDGGLRLAIMHDNAMALYQFDG